MKSPGMRLNQDRRKQNNGFGKKYKKKKQEIFMKKEPLFKHLETQEYAKLLELLSSAFEFMDTHQKQRVQCSGFSYHPKQRVY